MAATAPARTAHQTGPPSTRKWNNSAKLAAIAKKHKTYTKRDIFIYPLGRGIRAESCLGFITLFEDKF